MSKLIEGEDFYFTPEGFVVMTEKYHLKRGTCCGNGCRHCPFNYSKVTEPLRTELILKQQSTANQEIKKDP